MILLQPISGVARIFNWVGEGTGGCAFLRGKKDILFFLCPFVSHKVWIFCVGGGEHLGEGIVVTPLQSINSAILFKMYGWIFSQL